MRRWTDGSSQEDLLARLAHLLALVLVGAFGRHEDDEM
jgi:hypothetical protein